MSDILPTISLYRNVKITRDYSVVHDMNQGDWMRYLENINDVQGGDPSPPSRIYSRGVNYYRLPDVIRLEGRYDLIRTATYGMLSYIEGPENHIYFFWVDSVRLVKASVNDTGTRNDVVELTVSADVWSNKFTDCQLYDTFIARRHELRWFRDHTDPDDPDAWVYHPRYFPNAADDVGGAYEPEGDPQDLTAPLEFPGVSGEFDLRFIVINALDNDGKQRIIIGCNATNETGVEYPVYTQPNGNKAIFSLGELMAGDVFGTETGDTGIGASEVQSITVTPFIEAINGAVNIDSNNHLYIKDSYIPFASNFNVVEDNVNYIEANTSLAELQSGLYSFHQHDVDPKLPRWVYIPNNPFAEEYSDRNEPMLYRSPARIRRVTSGMGGTIVEVPDIDAFRETYTCQNIFELDQAIVVVFGGGLIEKANALGNIGTIVGASLPIFSSAWKEYQAIQKAGDDIAFNAQQVSTVIGTFTGAGAGMAGGAIAGASGGPVGAAAGAAVGVIGGVVGGATKYWSNSENLRARRETIKNSPCNVKSGGAGLGAYIKDYIDVHYQPLKLDQVSLEKLRTQYYYFGYNINMIIPGTIDTKIRKYFDYIETRGAHIKGHVNAEEGQRIADIFDRGVRIYHGADGYKMIDAGMNMENPERQFLED